MKNNMNDVNLRNLSLRIIEDIYKENVFIGDAIDMHTVDYDLDKQSRAFINRLVNGTVENTILIDYVIDQFSKTKTKKMKNIILYIIRLSVYQILYMDSVPDSAACNEAVKLTKKRKFHQLTGFVNGVLRNIARNREEIQFPNEEEDRIAYLCVTYSTPEWLVNYLLNQYEYIVVKEILEASLCRPEITIRQNPILCNMDELKETLEADNVVFSEGKIFPYALKITELNRIKDLEAFEKGYFQVQDESSMLVTEAIKPEENSVIIDLCAAPGGKTTHLAAAMSNTGQVISRDLSKRKLGRIKENISRLGLTNVDVSFGDATLIDREMIGVADIVLADVPCSGLGIIKKKPDIKYNASLDGINELIKIQRKILENAAMYVRDGGTLVYSTCTINRHENDENVEWFLDKHKEYTLVNLDLGYHINNNSDKGYISLLPEKDGIDGFFIAKLQKGC